MVQTHKFDSYVSCFSEESVKKLILDFWFLGFEFF